MNISLLVTLMIATAIVISLIPYVGFMIGHYIFSLSTCDAYVLISIYLAILLITFGLCFGSFALMQQQTCKKVKNYKQIASNSGIATAIQAIGMPLVAFMPFIRSFVGSILPNYISYTTKESISYGYFAFWFSLFGTAIGGTFSAVC